MYKNVIIAILATLVVTTHANALPSFAVLDKQLTTLIELLQQTNQKLDWIIRKK